MELIKLINSNLNTDVLPLSLINSLLKNKSDHARKAILKRACQKGDLIRVKNALYLVGEEKRKSPYNPFQIANLIASPSYISLESALSYYGLIPEAVYTTTSVTPKNTFEQKSPVGHFSFSYLKTDYFNFGFYKVDNPNNHFLIATPLKALIDYIVLNKKHYRTIEEIHDDLRFDFDEFVTYKKFVNQEKISELLNIYKSYRIQVILKDLRKKL